MLRVYSVNPGNFDNAMEIASGLFARLSIPKDFETYDCMMLLFARTPERSTVHEALNLWKEIQLYCVFENKILPKHNYPTSALDSIREKMMREETLETLREKSNCNLIDFMMLAENEDEIRFWAPNNYIPLEDGVWLHMQRQYQAKSTTYASLLKIFADNVRPEEGESMETRDEKLLPLYILFRDYSRMHFPLREAYVRLLPILYTQDSMILAHINLGDMQRAVEWFDGMQGDGYEDIKAQTSEIDGIRGRLKEREFHERQGVFY
jgi:hypothetical protein